MDLVDVIWHGPYDAWTLQGECRPGEQLPVQIPREQAEASDYYEIIEPARPGKPGRQENPIVAAATDSAPEAGS
jgi:hypothetical protein